ncbi:MAG: GIY-YIG nuclease family protein [Pseudomonadota bacterium]
MSGFFIMYYLYILHSSLSDKYYVGSSSDPRRRLVEHNTSDFLIFTSKHCPWVLVATFEAGSSRSEAEALERFIKRQKSRKLINRLVDSSFVPDGPLAQLVSVPHVRD